MMLSSVYDPKLTRVACFAAQRKANRAGRKPSFLQKKAKPQKLKADHDPDLDAAGLLLAPVPKISDDSSREEKGAHSSP